MDLDFNENERGVHLMEASGGEITLCGEAWDNTEEGQEVMKKTAYTVVTCPECIEVIKYVRKAHYRERR